MQVLIAGCGYVGLALGARLVAQGHRVTGIRRPGSDLEPLRRIGLIPLAIDLADAGQVEALPGDWDWVFHCVAPAARGETAYRAVYLASARNLAARLRGEPQTRVVFTSSTSVYGQLDGGPVTETSPTEPATATARVLLETEAAWLGERDAVVLRVSGLYGPGRHRLGALARGEARLHGDGSRRMNLIHRDDLVEAAIAVAERAPAGSVFNVSDDAPPTEREFYSWICKRLGLGLPSSEPCSSRGPTGEGDRRNTNKRVVATRLRQATGWCPSYPTFREGYEPLLVEWPGRIGAAGDR